MLTLFLAVTFYERLLCCGVSWFVARTAKYEGVAGGECKTQARSGKSFLVRIVGECVYGQAPTRESTFGGETCG